MGRSSREKGKRGERELSRALNGLGFDTRRGQQFNGADGSADVVGLPGIHVECKRTESFRLWDALAQARRDARDGEVPVVMHRRNDCPWVAVMELEDWAKLYREWMPLEEGGEDGEESAGDPRAR